MREGSAALDIGNTRDAVGGPDVDTKAWVVIGVVEDDTPDAQSVSFTDETGAPWPLGVRVMVKCQPSGIVIPCRVSNTCAGNGEGEFHPFSAKDEVLVVIPMGDEKNGGVIIGRLNQTFDVLPAAVAGQDVTKNTVAYKRLIPPYILESGTSVIIRVAPTGAALTLDPTGNTYLSSGSGASLYLRSDAVSLQLDKGTAAFQLDPSDDSVKFVSGDGSCVFHSDGKDDQYQTAGTIAFSTLGNAGVNHVITTEAVAAVLQAYSLAASAALALNAGPITGAQAAAVFTALGGAALAAVFTAAGGAPPSPATVQAIHAALLIPKTLGLPGVGSPGVTVD